MSNYYLTEMNLLKLENRIYKFILNEGLGKILTNGVTAKIVNMMYTNNIDYYYSDYIATAVNVPIKFVDNIYLYNQSRYYQQPLHILLKTTDYEGTPEEAKQFERDIKEILKTKKKIHTNKKWRMYKHGNTKTKRRNNNNRNF